MNTRHITTGITAAVMLASSTLVFAADAAKAESARRLRKNLSGRS